MNDDPRLEEVEGTDISPTAAVLLWGLAFCGRALLWLAAAALLFVFLFLASAP